MAELPFGRGPRMGTDAIIAQRESFASRARDIVKHDEWVLSPMRNYGSDMTDGTGFGPTIRLMLLPRIESPFQIYSARCRITTAHASNEVRSALYRYSTELATQHFVKVASTEAAFDTSSTGLQDIVLENVATLQPGIRYFIGVQVSSTSIGLPSEKNTTSRLIPILAYSYTVGVLPTRINMTSVTKNYTLYAPWLLYLSKTAADLL